MNTGRGIVLFGDVVDSRRDPTAASEWLRDLAGGLDGLYGSDRLAPFGFTQGDELQGLLVETADPLTAVLVAGLAELARPMRWVAVAGEVAEGQGPATERSGPAFIGAREAIDRVRRQRDRLLLVTGDPHADGLLADLAPLLGEMVAQLTPRQRTIARLALVDGLRQADVAEALHVSRATISVTYGRGGVRSIGRLADATRAIFREGVAAGSAAWPSPGGADRP